MSIPSDFPPPPPKRLPGNDRVEPVEYGLLHWPATSPRAALALTHGAGSNAESPLLKGLAEALAAAGILVYRYNLPYRRLRPRGSPSPGGAEADREGIRAAAEFVRRLASGPVLCGGHSYGGRQTSMAAAADPQLAGALLLLSYPLHPPKKPEALRTAHFAGLRARTQFLHGSRDPFGSPAEMRSALALIPGPVRLHIVEKAGHDLAKNAQPSSCRTSDRNTFGYI